MNYINEKAQLVTVEGDIREDKYAIISSTKWTQILRSIHRNKSSDLFSAISPRVDFKPLAFQSLLKLNSVPLVFDMSGLQFTKLVNYVNSSEVEHIGYIVFDSNLCKVYFEVDDTAQSTAIETVVNYLPGYSFKGRNNTVVISTIHTHPEEENIENWELQINNYLMHNIEKTFLIIWEQMVIAV
ncbi:hypothetical protein A8C56_18015 [Niabella ginsenosidivorans]|uniref:Uncharacterized protein n=1 Tax=Niabella ginsenosidivorans TaxID=1176587 RepID=A0A1A9I4K9_9BACT|nr:hypothetical protein [Niabella ginsenosidivorans]ANH82617.1 hypothetical protein A8C56_18015 [Niabella ginsenosidivorans]